MISNNVWELRSKHFTIARANESEAIDCTMVWSKDEFWFFNQKFGMQTLTKAHPNSNIGGFVLYIAGNYLDRDELPFKIMDNEGLAAYNELVQALDGADIAVKNAKTVREQAAQAITQFLGIAA